MTTGAGVRHPLAAATGARLWPTGSGMMGGRWHAHTWQAGSGVGRCNEKVYIYSLVSDTLSAHV
jgi:hypothetical protein